MMQSSHSQVPFLKARDLDTVLATSHDSNRTDAIPGVADDVLFDNSTCALLSPEVTQGPYCMLSTYRSKKYEIFILIFQGSLANTSAPTLPKARLAFLLSMRFS